MKKELAIIFGANGQDGFYLNKLLKSENIESITVSRNNCDYKGDVSSFDFVKSLISKYQPDYIFHFAANSTTRHDALFDNHQAIGSGTLNILEAVYNNSRHSKVFIAGSGLQFLNKGEPINEHVPFEAQSPYAATRIYAVYLARYYRSLGLKIYIGYLFNHESPLRKQNYISQKVIQAVKSIHKGESSSLEIGNLLIEKEWNYAGDIVEAILILVKQDVIFEAVIGSGKSYSIMDWVGICFSLVNLNWTDYVNQSKDFVPAYQKLVSEPSLIKKLGWQPRVNIRELAKIMFENL